MPSRASPHCLPRLHRRPPPQIGEPRVNYRETITQRADFNYLHKKQSGGSGQFARVIGYLEPLPEVDAETAAKIAAAAAAKAAAAGGGKEVNNADFEFVNGLVGNNIPPEYVPACEKGFREGQGKGAQIGHPVQGVRVVLTDGQTHVVDSNEMAFRIASASAFREAFLAAKPSIMEPIMKVRSQLAGAAGGLPPCAPPRMCVASQHPACSRSRVGVGCFLWLSSQRARAPVPLSNCTARPPPRPTIPAAQVEVTLPHEFQGVGIALINKRKGQLTGSDAQEMAVVVEAEVPLSAMFGFSTDLRSATQVRERRGARARGRVGARLWPLKSCTLALALTQRPPRLHARARLRMQGKGEFTMEYMKHSPVGGDVRRELVKRYEAERLAERK